jgi:hypothetical protein
MPLIPRGAATDERPQPLPTAGVFSFCVSQNRLCQASRHGGGDGVAKLEWLTEIRSPRVVNVTAVPAARSSYFRCVYHLLKLLKLRSQLHELEKSSAQNSRTVKSLGAATHGPL